MDFDPCKDGEHLEIVHADRYECHVDVLVLEIVTSSASNDDDHDHHGEDELWVIGTFFALAIDPEVPFCPVSANSTQRTSWRSLDTFALPVSCIIKVAPSAIEASTALTSPLSGTSGTIASGITFNLVDTSSTTLADGDNFAKVEFTFDGGAAGSADDYLLELYLEDMGNIDSSAVLNRIRFETEI